MTIAEASVLRHHHSWQVPDPASTTPRQEDPANSEKHHNGLTLLQQAGQDWNWTYSPSCMHQGPRQMQYTQICLHPIVWFLRLCSLTPANGVEMRSWLIGQPLSYALQGLNHDIACWRKTWLNVLWSKHCRTQILHSIRIVSSSQESPVLERICMYRIYGADSPSIASLRTASAVCGIKSAHVRVNKSWLTWGKSWLYKAVFCRYLLADTLLLLPQHWWLRWLDLLPKQPGTIKAESDTFLPS